MKPMKPDIDPMSFFEGYDPAKERAEKNIEQEKQDIKNKINQELYAEVNEILLNQVYFKSEPSKVSESKPAIIKILTQDAYETELLHSQVFRQDEDRILKENITLMTTVKPELLPINITEIITTARNKLQALTPEERDKKDKENWEIFKEAIEIKNAEIFKKAIEIEKAKNIPKNKFKKNGNIPRKWLIIENLEKDYEQAKFYESFFIRDGFKPKKCVGCGKFYSPISPINNPFKGTLQVSCTECGSVEFIKHGTRIKRGKDGGVVTIQKYQCKRCASFFNSSWQKS